MTYLDGLLAASSSVSHYLSTLDEFVEAARVAVLRLILVQKGQSVLIEYFEKLVPFDFLEFILGFAKIDAQNAAFSFGADDGRVTITDFRPFANLFMVRC